MARSEKVKKCFINQENLAFLYLSQGIYLTSLTYNFKGLLKDISQFIYDVNQELKDIHISPITSDDISFQIDQKCGLFVLVYRDEIKINEQQKELIKTHQWIVDQQIQK